MVKAIKIHSNPAILNKVILLLLLNPNKTLKLNNNLSKLLLLHKRLLPRNSLPLKKKLKRKPLLRKIIKREKKKVRKKLNLIRRPALLLRKRENIKTLSLRVNMKRSTLKPY